MSSQEAALIQAARELAQGLRQQQVKIVFAESCTAGLAASALADVEGISEFHCGSAVVYRNATKTAWLGVDAGVLADPQQGPVSASVAMQLCEGVLAKTPEADLAVSVTGHVGPNAPPELDGVIYIASLRRGASAPTVQRRTLSNVAWTNHSLRRTRQIFAATIVLQVALAAALNGDD